MKRKVLLVLFSLLMICTTACAREALYDMNNSDSLFDETNIVDDTKIEKIKEGMTYGEVISLIGKANGERGSGFIIFSYACNSGKTLNLWMGQEESGADPLIVEAIRVE